MTWYFNRIVFDPNRLLTNYFRVRVCRAGTNLQELCAHGHAMFLKLGKMQCSSCACYCMLSSAMRSGAEDAPATPSRAEVAQSNF